jgi:hypothetical protein
MSALGHGRRICDGGHGFYILFFLIAGFVATLAMLVALMARC